MPIILPDIRVEAVPELPTLLAQRVDALGEVPVGVEVFVSRYQVVPTRGVSLPLLRWPQRLQ